MDYIKLITAQLDYIAREEAKKKLILEFKDEKQTVTDLLSEEDQTPDQNITREVRDRYRQLLLQEQHSLINKAVMSITNYISK